MADNNNTNIGININGNSSSAEKSFKPVITGLDDLKTKTGIYIKETKALGEAEENLKKKRSKSTDATKKQSEKTKENTKVTKDNTRTLKDMSVELIRSARYSGQLFHALGRFSATKFLWATAGGYALGRLYIHTGKVIKAFGEFEEALIGVKSVLNENIDSVEELKNRTFGLSETYHTSSIKILESTKAVNNLGFRPLADTMLIVEAGTKLATAAGKDQVQVTETLTKVMNAFGYSAKETNNVSTLLFNAFKVGNIDIEKLGERFGSLVGPAKDFGFSLEEVLSVYAGLSRNMGDLQAFRTLEYFFRALESSATGLAKEGISLSSVFSKSGGLIKGLQELKNLGFTTAESFRNIGASSREVEQSLNVMSQSTDALNEAFKGTTKGSEDLNKATADNLGTTKSSVAELKETWTNFRNDMVSSWAPDIVAAIKSMTTAINFWKSKKPPTKKDVFQSTFGIDDESLAKLEASFLAAGKNFTKYIDDMLDTTKKINEIKYSIKNLTVFLDELQKERASKKESILGEIFGTEALDKEIVRTENRIKEATARLTKQQKLLEFQKLPEKESTEQAEKKVKALETQNKLLEIQNARYKELSIEVDSVNSVEKYKAIEVKLRNIEISGEKWATALLINLRKTHSSYAKEIEKSIKIELKRKQTIINAIDSITKAALEAKTKTGQGLERKSLISMLLGDETKGKTIESQLRSLDSLRSTIINTIDEVEQKKNKLKLKQVGFAGLTFIAPEDSGVFLKYTTDLDKLQGILKVTEDQFRSLVESFKETNAKESFEKGILKPAVKVAERVEKTFGRLGEKLARKNLAGSILGTGKTAASLKSELSLITAEIDSEKRALEGLNKAISEMGRSTLIGTGAFALDPEQLEKSNKLIASITKHIAELTGKMETLTSELKAAKIDEDLDKSFKKIKTSYNSLIKSLGKKSLREQFFGKDPTKKDSVDDLLNQWKSIQNRLKDVNKEYKTISEKTSTITGLTELQAGNVAELSNMYTDLNNKLATTEERISKAYNIERFEKFFGTLKEGADIISESFSGLIGGYGNAIGDIATAWFSELDDMQEATAKWADSMDSIYKQFASSVISSLFQIAAQQAALGIWNSVTGKAPKIQVPSGGAGNVGIALGTGISAYSGSGLGGNATNPATVKGVELGVASGMEASTPAVADAVKTGMSSTVYALGAVAIGIGGVASAFARISASGGSAQQKEAKQTNALLGTIGGAVVGGVIGSIVPGGGTVVGASIGAGIGAQVGALFRTAGQSSAVSDGRKQPQMLGDTSGAATPAQQTGQPSLVIHNLSIMEGAHVDKDVINMPPEKMRKWVRDSILPALTHLGKNGETIGMPYKGIK